MKKRGRKYTEEFKEEAVKLPLTFFCVLKIPVKNNFFVIERKSNIDG